MNKVKRYNITLNKDNPIFPYDGSLISLETVKIFKVCDLNLTDGFVTLHFLKEDGKSFKYIIKTNYDLYLDETGKLNGNFITAQFAITSTEVEAKFVCELTHI